MRALTIRQPWADAIAHGTKRVENRTWRAPAQHIGTRILIHAGLQEDRHAILPYGQNIACSVWPDNRRAIIAVATLSESHRASDARCCDSDWAEPDVYHWLLHDVTKLPEPVPCNGRLGLWTPPFFVLDAVAEQIAGAR